METIVAKTTVVFVFEMRRSAHSRICARHFTAAYLYSKKSTFDFPVAVLMSGSNSVDIESARGHANQGDISYVGRSRAHLRAPVVSGACALCGCGARARRYH